MLVDDHPMWRQTLRKVLEQDRAGKVVAEAADGDEAVRMAAEIKPDVVVMDINLPVLGGIEATRRVRAVLPSAKILVLSASERRSDVIESVRAGASGYLLKTTEPADLVEAVRRVHRGEMVFPPELAEIVLGEIRGGEAPDARPLRIALGDASPLFRDGLARMLEETGFEIVGLASDEARLLRLVAEASPDVVVTDVLLTPTGHEGRAVAGIRSEHPDVGVLVLSQDVDVRAASSLLSESPRGVGYLLKTRVADVGQLAEAIRRVANGGSVLDPEVATRLVQPRDERQPVNDLTKREREVLVLMAEGRSNQAISERLFLSAKAVEAHVRNIFMKLGLEPAADDHRRVLAVIAYLRSA